MSYNNIVERNARNYDNWARKHRLERFFVDEADFSTLDNHISWYPRPTKRIFDSNESGNTSISEIKTLLDKYSRVYVREGTHYVYVFVSNEGSGFKYENATTYKPNEELKNLFA